MINLSELHLLDATEGARLIREGVITSEQLVNACLAQISAVDSRIQAWTYLDSDSALSHARAADKVRKAGGPVGPLHGVPVGIKDIFDTADMPTENGSVIFAGRRPTEDSAFVALLRAAGAVILGKTVTTEFALSHPGKTLNPYNPEHTPGGSSSGSAAAVASYMVPIASGSQTIGSTIRPAAYCGIIGFKPTYGLISRYGMLSVSRTLDHVGLFARSVQDIALLLNVACKYDPRDPDQRPFEPVDYQVLSLDVPPRLTRFAFIKTPLWDEVDTDTKIGFAEVINQLGDSVEELTFPLEATEYRNWIQTVMTTELAANHKGALVDHRDLLSDRLRGQIERGLKVKSEVYEHTLRDIQTAAEVLETLFRQGYDAILTPATLGTAPKDLTITGNPTPCALWTMCGLPSITLPLLKGSNGLPIGLQLVGPRNGDAQLLRTSRWIQEKVLKKS